jgi:O-antigen ligase
MLSVNIPYNCNMRKDLSTIIIVIFLLILPFIINIYVSDMVLAIRYLSLSVFIFLLYLLNFGNGIITNVFKSPIVISLFLLFSINIISAFYHNFTADAIFSLSRLFVLISLSIFFSNFFIKKDFLFIARSVLIFALTSLLIYFAQIYIAFTNEKDFMSSIETVSATMGNKNLLASILFLSLPFLFYVYQSANKLWKILVLFLLVLILCSLLLIQSKAVLLGLFFMSVSIILLAFRGNSKIILSFTVIICMITSIFFITNPKVFKHFNQEIDQIVKKKERIDNNRIVENDGRVALYLKTIDMIKDNPLLGVGPGNWRKELPKYGLKNTVGQKGNKFVQRPHSDFLWLFAEGGILSGILYILLFVLILRDALFFYLNMKDKKRYFFLILFSTMLGYMVISLLDFPVERPTHNLFLAIILGIIISERLKNIKSYNSSNKLVGIILMCLFSVNIAFSSIRYNGDLHMTKALNYKSMSDWEGMIAELDIAYNQSLYDIDNTTTPLMWYYGLAYFNKGEVSIAFGYFQKAYSVNPYHLHVINNLATCYGYNNNYNKAKELYKEGISISPRFEEAALNLAAIYSYEQRDEEALDILLGVRNFRIENNTHLSKTYIQYFNRIFAKIRDDVIGEKKKMIILATNRNKFYNQLKYIYWMREKGNSYETIIKDLTL